MRQNNEYLQPLVSVIIPTYNRLHYLPEAIASAVQQTYQNIEIIVCDNCSEISPQAIIDTFQDPRIRLWRNDQNIGMVANIKNGFNMAKGKYVASLHDDDMWEKDYLAKLVTVLEDNPDLALAFCDYHIIDADNKIDYTLTEEVSLERNRTNLKAGIYRPFYDLAINMSIGSANAAVIRKDIVDWQAIPLEVGGCYDLYINYLCSCSGLGAYYSPERLTRYRIHQQSETLTDNPQVNIGKARNHIFCYEQFIEDTRLEQLQPYFRRRLIESTYVLGVNLLVMGELKAARTCFKYIIKRKKFSKKAMTGLFLTFSPSLVALRSRLPQKYFSQQPI
ncbi:glycosyltransferase family 2 protein [Cronbergia sp. UHCC 0137]|uniref:glycosyltransferase family 2 protein n=1 Tax=Cronbergia sp. UHCC 0137 TaxID=3110239 RepID=UPI002B1FBA6B|nr:glycosyltransferase family 2 protein [Cronbergia sp. UHCC 0137]MEA5616714.1 glycosyltransferase family 2 protein [Cronbergia sp. UHCC 0137]